MVYGMLCFALLLLSADSSADGDVTDAIALRERAGSAPPRFSLAVIGMAGSGKSTVLNALIENDDDDSEDAENGDEPEEAFKEGNGATSCTKEVARKEFNINHGTFGPITLELVDTMGFPDTNPRESAKFYDKVIQAVAEPLNGLLWIVKMDRTLQSGYEKFEVLMGQFQSLQVPLILLINNHGNYAATTKKDQKKMERKREEDRGRCEDFARQLLTTTGLQSVVTKTIVSTDKQELAKFKDELAIILYGTTPKRSHLKTYSRVVAEYKEAEKKHNYAAEVVKNSQREITGVQTAMDTQLARKNEVKYVEHYDDVVHYRETDYLEKVFEGKHERYVRRTRTEQWTEKVKRLEQVKVYSAAEIDAVVEEKRKYKRVLEEKLRALQQNKDELNALAKQFEIKARALTKALEVANAEL